ncbi:hypothetical protein OF83DRAFT_1085866 [Amylostereum chailletii]|nr:hypothetical protein OF83DRAFT_1085866 [Amylostereum chailletii]
MKSFISCSNVVLALLLAGRTLAATYAVTDTFTGQGFFDNFDWIAEADPTNGLDGTQGTPMASFPNTSCDIDSHFNTANIIINLTFCGDWAGNVYSSSGCPSTCNDYVSNNPSAFTNAYFELASTRVYQ